MAQTRSAKVTLRMTEEGAKRLEAIAKREKVSQAVLVERLLENAEEDPTGYYLRAAAIHSWTASTLATVLVNHAFKADAPLILRRAAEQSRALFGPLPAAPREATQLDTADPRVVALLDAYGVLK